MREPDGFRALLEQQTPSLLRRAFLLCRDWHMAEDLVQDTAMMTLKKWRHVCAAQNPKAYIHTLLTNSFLTQARKRSYSEAATDFQIPQSVNPWPNVDLELRIAESLSVLSPAERVVIIARYYDSLPVREVAANLKRTESWVRVTAHRALAKLKVDLSEAEPVASGPRRAIESYCGSRGDSEQGGAR